MDNLKTLQNYLETTVSENNNNTNVSATSDNNMTAIGGGGVLSETSYNNMTAVGGAESAEPVTDAKTDVTDAKPTVDANLAADVEPTADKKNPASADTKQEGGFFNSLFVKNSKDNESNELLKLLETTQTSNVSPANINTATMDKQVAKLLGGDLNVTESLTTEAMEQQLRELLGGKKN